WAGRRSVIAAEGPEEGGIEVDRLVARAVERAHRRGGRAAGRLRGSAIEDDAGCPVAVHLGRPVGVERVARAGHAALVVRVRVGARLAVLETDGLLARLRLTGHHPGEGAQIDA